MRTAAIRATATNARCSMVTLSASLWPVGDRSPRGERDDSRRDAETPTTRHGSDRVRETTAARIPSMSAQTDMPTATTGIPAADSRSRRSPRSTRRSSNAPRPGNAGQCSPQLRRQAWERLRQRRRPTDDHHRRPFGCRITTGAVSLPEPTPRAVPLHSVLELSAHRKPCARRPRRLAPQDNEGRPFDPSASLEERLKISAGGQPLASGKATRYTVSRLRPLARRRLSTFRPPFVFMRSRKPCVFARRRRLG